jgi:hypothetical protein
MLRLRRRVPPNPLSPKAKSVRLAEGSKAKQRFRPESFGKLVVCQIDDFEVKNIPHGIQFYAKPPAGKRNGRGESENFATNKDIKSFPIRTVQT